MASPAELINRICQTAKLDSTYRTLAATAAWAYDSSGSSYTNETTDAGDEGANDYTLPNPFDSSDAMIIGHNVKFTALRINVGTAGVGDAVAAETVWEYFNGLTWSTLTVTDGTSKLTVAGENTVSFTPPSDWRQTTQSTSASLYYIRMRATANAVYNTTAPLITQVMVQELSADRQLALSFLQEAADKVALATHSRVPTEASVTLVSGTAAYALNSSPFPTDMLGLHEMRITDGAVTNEPLRQVSLGQINEYRSGSQSNATPYCYAVDYPQIVFYPTPGASTTLKVYYPQDAPTLADNSTEITFIPKAFHWGCLYTLALSRALAYKGQDSVAAAYNAEYLGDRQSGLPALKRWRAEMGGALPAEHDREFRVTSPSQDWGF